MSEERPTGIVSLGEFPGVLEFVGDTGQQSYARGSASDRDGVNVRVRIEPLSSSRRFRGPATMIDPAWWFISMIAGGIGFVLFVYGRKQQRWPHLFAGLLLMVYPYFTPGLPGLCGVGAAIVLGLWLTVRQGW